MRENNQIQEDVAYFEDEIDLMELFNVIWKSKILIIIITAIFAIGSVIYSISLTNYYKSESLLIARGNAAAQNYNQYSGFAALAGVSLPTSGEDKISQAIELIQSRTFVRHLLTFDNILPSIMAPKSYSRVTKELAYDEDIYNSKTMKWNTSADGQSMKPSYLQAHREYLKNIVSVSRDKMTGFIKIEVEHISPIFARDFLDLVITEANELLRKKDMEESRQGLDYLKIELSKTPLVEIQESINTLIEAQLEKQMMTQINKDYILIRIDPPFIPDKKSKPVRSFICIVGTIIGGFLSLCFVLIRHFFFEETN